MAMCWTRRGEHFEELEKRQDTLFHTPGDATGYLEKVNLAAVDPLSGPASEARGT